MPVPVKTDTTLSSSVELAHAAAVSIAEAGTVGEHIGFVMDGERIGTHSFVCTSRAYRGWRWAVTVARAPRSKTVTVCETHLLPTEDAVLAPEWVPYEERLAPGDIGPGDVTPYVEADPLLPAPAEGLGRVRQAAADLRSRPSEEVSFGGITFRRYRGGAGFGVPTDAKVAFACIALADEDRPS